MYIAGGPIFSSPATDFYLRVSRGPLITHQSFHVTLESEVLTFVASLKEAQNCVSLAVVLELL